MDFNDQCWRGATVIAGGGETSANVEAGSD